MKLDQNGVNITSCVNISTSVLGNEFIVMWDSDGIPIHINRDVVNRLYLFMTQTQNPLPNSDNVFVK